jgi:hypothetical protein
MKPNGIPIPEICKIYVESPLVCVSGVAGANLRKRVEAILREHAGIGLSPAKRQVLAAAGALALTAPYPGLFDCWFVGVLPV